MTQRFLFLLSLLACTQAFAPVPSSGRAPAVARSTRLNFGIPSFGPKNEDEPQDPNLEKETKIGLKGLVQLITAGKD